MNVLLVGAAGHVGTILRPALEARHNCRYLDLRPVEGAEERTVVGSVTDPVAMAESMEGIDVAVQLAMAKWQQPPADNVDGMYDVHVKGMHRVLEAAVAAKVRRVVYASTLSVYQSSRPMNGHRNEETPPDATNLYGLTKRLGEEVCRAFAKANPELSVLALQMVLPRTEAQWREPLPNPRADRNYMTGPDDLRRAYLNAIEHPDHVGYDAIFICSDVDGKYLDLGKAERVLDWVPAGA